VVALAKQRSERERACDDLVLTSGSLASNYAEQLLDIARAGRLSQLAAAAALTLAHPGPLREAEHHRGKPGMLARWDMGRM